MNDRVESGSRLSSRRSAVWFAVVFAVVVAVIVVAYVTGDDAARSVPPDDGLGGDDITGISGPYTPVEPDPVDQEALDHPLADACGVLQAKMAEAIERVSMSDSLDDLAALQTVFVEGTDDLFAVARSSNTPKGVSQDDWTVVVDGSEAEVALIVDQVSAAITAAEPGSSASAVSTAITPTAPVEFIFEFDDIVQVPCIR